MQEGEPRDYAAGNAPHAPWLGAIDDRYHLALVPQPLPLGGRDWIWLGLRRAGKPRFRAWDLELMHELAHVSALAAGEALALSLMAMRMAAYLTLDRAALGAKSSKDVVLNWARTVFAAVGADGGMVRLPGDRPPVQLCAVECPPLLTPTLDAMAEALKPGSVELLDMRQVEGSRVLGGYGLLAPFATHGEPAWLFAHFKREPGKFSAMLIAKALPELLAALRAHAAAKVEPV